MIRKQTKGEEKEEKYRRLNQQKTTTTNKIIYQMQQNFVRNIFVKLM